MRHPHVAGLVRLLRFRAGAAPGPSASRIARVRRDDPASPGSQLRPLDIKRAGRAGAQRAQVAVQDYRARTGHMRDAARYAVDDGGREPLHGRATCGPRARAGFATRSSAPGRGCLPARPGREGPFAWMARASLRAPCIVIARTFVRHPKSSFDLTE